MGCHEAFFVGFVVFMKETANKRKHANAIIIKK